VGAVVHADKGRCPTPFLNKHLPLIETIRALWDHKHVFVFELVPSNTSAAPQRAQRRRWPQPAAAPVARSFRGLPHPGLGSAFLSLRYWSGDEREQRAHCPCRSSPGRRRRPLGSDSTGECVVLKGG